MISDNPQGPRLTLNAGAAMMGDSAAASADPVIVSVTVTGGTDCTLQLYTAAGCVAQQSVTDDSFSFVAPIQIDRYVRAQLVNANGLIRALTNPIYSS